MQTARAYVKKSIKLAFVIIATIVVSFIILSLVVNFLPNRISSGIAFYILHAKKEIGFYMAFAVLCFLVCFLAYKAYRVIKTTDAPLQEFKKMIPAAIMWLLVAYAASAFLSTIYDRTSCEHHNYTERLNGGVKEINGKKYNIRMCGDGGDSNQNDDRVQLEIFNDNGELLAKRHFTVHWDGGFHEPIKIQQGHIIYFDASEENDYKKTLSVPPTSIDWIRARLPLFN